MGQERVVHMVYREHISHIENTFYVEQVQSASMGQERVVHMVQILKKVDN